MRRILAVAALLAGAAAVMPGTGHAATPSPCVAVIVDSGQSTRTGCTGWRSGLTGYDALTSTGHTLAFRPTDGLLCQIDGVPPTCHPDTTHYWSYWHRAPGASAWTYSQLGGGGYHPAANSTEGWAYVDGSQSARQPPNVAFTTICPPPPPAPPAPAPRTTAGGAPAAQHPAPPPSPGATATATATPASGVADASSPPPATSTGPAGRRSSQAGAITHRGGGGPGALPAMIAAALVAALGAGGAWQVRRRRRGVTGPTA
ncbi:MAG: hypothetical protein ACJ73S_01195 [Mycobacteriales bacterium]